MKEGVDHRGRPRVVVTGMGLASPAGNEIPTFWDALVEARPAAAPIRRFDASSLPVRFGCEVVDVDVAGYVGAKEARRLDRSAALAVVAGLDAVRDAQAAAALDVDPARSAVVAGTGIGGLDSLIDQQTVYAERGSDRVSPFLVPMMMPNAAAAHLAMRLGWTGPALCVATACAAGANAIGEALRLLRAGVADVVLAGGTEAALTPLTLAAFWRMGALSTRNDAPSRASRPFDVDRDGFVMGEGAGFLVLERLDVAERRGARVRAEFLGYAANADAHHVTAPRPDGAGAAACMASALTDAGLAPEDVGHVNAHGTSTPLNDAAEAEALRKVFADAVPPVTSTKGVTGHLIGAAGAVEAIASLLAVDAGLVPPTANHERTDPGIDLDVVTTEPRVVRGPALSNSFGFGGHNACLVVGPA